MPPARFVRANQAVDPGHESAALPLEVMPRYFETVRTPIVAGRAIGEQDSATAAHVAVISQSLAQRYFPGEEAVGQSVRLLDQIPGVWRIVGVAADIRGAGLAEETQPIVYLPHAQAPAAVMTFVMRTRGEPAAVGPAAERALWSLGSLMNVYNLVTLRQTVEESYWQTRFTMILLGIFAAVALALAGAGIYAVISYLAAQRTREIGIRVALGARPPEVLWMIVTQALRLGGAGVGCGLAASLAIGRVLASRLYGVAAADPATLAAVGLGLLLVAVAASALPALRASRVDPLEALRAE
jgi:predicted permease